MLARSLRLRRVVGFAEAWQSSLQERAFAFVHPALQSHHFISHLLSHRIFTILYLTPQAQRAISICSQSSKSLTITARKSLYNNLTRIATASSQISPLL